MSQGKIHETEHRQRATSSINNKYHSVPILQFSIAYKIRTFLSESHIVLDAGGDKLSAERSRLYVKQ